MSDKEFDYLPVGTEVRYEFDPPEGWKGYQTHTAKPKAFRFGKIEDPGYEVPKGFAPVRFVEGRGDEETLAELTLVPGDDVHILRAYRGQDEKEVSRRRRHEKRLDEVGRDVEKLRDHEREQIKLTREIEAERIWSGPENHDSKIAAFSDQGSVKIGSWNWALIYVKLDPQAAIHLANHIYDVAQEALAQ